MQFVAAAAVSVALLAGHVNAGIDVLRAEGFARLQGRRVALLTNLSARTRDGIPTVDVLRDAPGVQLVALLTPEHGLAADVDARVASGRDARTGLPIYSLYGDTRRPPPELLASVDVVVIDLPDVGARFYTYPTTVGYVLEEAAKHDVEVVLLDRPNPIGGVDIEGPMPDAGANGFTTYFPMPVRHGLTLGEMATLFNAERKIGARLTVVRMEGWRRDAWLDATGLPWANPSPNIRSLDEAALYPGMGAIESSNISVGRGTPTPFEVVGAPWIDGARLAAALTRRRIPGVRFTATSFTPESSEYAHQHCSGVAIAIDDRARLRPVRLGVEIASALCALYPGRYDLGATSQMLDGATARRIGTGDSPTAITRSWRTAEARWRRIRHPYLLYPPDPASTSR